MIAIRAKITLMKWVADGLITLHIQTSDGQVTNTIPIENLPMELVTKDHLMVGDTITIRVDKE